MAWSFFFSLPLYFLGVFHWISLCSVWYRVVYRPCRDCGGMKSNNECFDVTNLLLCIDVIRAFDLHWRHIFRDWHWLVTRKMWPVWLAGETWMMELKQLMGIWFELQDFSLDWGLGKYWNEIIHSIHESDWTIYCWIWFDFSFLFCNVSQIYHVITIKNPENSNKNLVDNSDNNGMLMTLDLYESAIIANYELYFINNELWFTPYLKIFPIISQKKILE